MVKWSKHLEPNFDNRDFTELYFGYIGYYMQIVNVYILERP